MKELKFVLLLILSSFSLNSQAQVSDIFREISLQMDTCNYSKTNNSIQHLGNNYLWFNYNNENEICQVKLYPLNTNASLKIKLEESGDYTIIDSVKNYNNQYFDFKVQFKNLTNSGFLKFRLQYNIDTIKGFYDINLFPTTNTTASIHNVSDELIVGEEKVFELISNHPENIKFNNDWDNNQDISYRITNNNGQLLIHLLPNSVGKKTLNLNISIKKPSIINKIIIYNLAPISYSFNIKSAGLVYLQPEKNEVILDDLAKNQGINFQFDNGRMLQLNKTYIIDESGQSGKSIVGTIYTKERLANNKMLCTLHLFNYHKQNDGYLYIKDGDEARFLTNFKIIPKTTIEKIKIMRNGKDWVEESTIYPGETINLRFEGSSLDKSRFNFDALIELANDSIIKNETFIEYKLKVPANITKNIISIYNYNQNTGKTLTVKEYQLARPFDYITLNYNDRNKIVSDFQGPELYDKTLKDLVISFKPEIVDSVTKFYGKQYVDIDVKIFNKNGELTDFATINDVCVCPSENSQRYKFYDRGDCNSNEISLNSKLNSYISNLKDWSKIRITFKNQKEKYNKEIQTKTIELVLQKQYSFDIDVSFPAGLLIKKIGDSDPNFVNFSGVSMAVIAQFSFYDKDKVAKFKPYKIGAGFIALNAFNFSQQSSDRDMGVVVIGTLNPVNTGRKLSFPIYLGTGYLLSQKKMFWLLGPGISVQF